MGKSAPQPPDPKETGAAATGTNIGTAIANAMMGNVDQIGPDGTKTTEKIGYYEWYDPYTGHKYDIPTFRETTTLSDAQQRIKDQQDAAQFNLSGLANQQSAFLKDYMAQPVSLDNEATEARLFDLGRKRLDPMFAQRESDLRARLTNMGLRPGSEAWNREWMNETQGRNDAYNELLLRGRGQAVQERLTERNQPLNEIGALLSGSQVDMPQFGAVDMPTIPTTDVGGLINENYNQRLGIWERQNAMTQNILGGLFSLGGKLIGLSDDRMKKNKRRLGDVDDDMGVWAFNYKGERAGTPKHIGLMASEVEKEKPGAIIRRQGLRFVDYGKALA